MSLLSFRFAPRILPMHIVLRNVIEFEIEK